MKHYWSCTKFANWLRGTTKPHSATGKEWSEWRDRAKTTHKFRYWLAEECLDSIQNFIWWPVDKLYSIKYWLLNRFRTKTHALTSSSLQRGQWHELDTRILHCLFDELVDFVEVELAWKHLVWSDKSLRKKYKMPWHAVGWFRLRTWRCPKAGLDYLDWETTLVWDESSGTSLDHPNYGKPTYQATKAKEVLELYYWWKNVHPNRPDPHEAGGWTEICNRRRDRDTLFWLGEDETDEEQEETSKALKLTQEIEDSYDAEDEEMLVRLIKIRRGLWS